MTTKAACVLLGGGLALVLALMATMDRMDGVGALCGILGVGAASVAVVAHMGRAGILRGFAVVQDPRAVGPLAEVCHGGGLGSNYELIAPLTHLIGRMRREHYAELTAFERQRVLGLLVDTGPASRSPAGANLKLAILKMLEQCGDEGAVAAVDHVRMFGRSPQVRSAANDCLQYLRTRLDEERPTARLLRPAVQPLPDTLLRPAMAATASDPAALLRPSEPEGEQGPATGPETDERAVLSSEG